MLVPVSSGCFVLGSFSPSPYLFWVFMCFREEGLPHRRSRHSGLSGRPGWESPAHLSSGGELSPDVCWAPTFRTGRTPEEPRGPLGTWAGAVPATASLGDPGVGPRGPGPPVSSRAWSHVPAPVDGFTVADSSLCFGLFEI